MGVLNVTIHLCQNGIDDNDPKLLEKNSPPTKLSVSTTSADDAGGERTLIREVSTDENTVDVADTQKGSNREHSDVWYRRFLKPMARRCGAQSYRNEFLRRPVRPMGIPVDQLGTLHEMFRPTHLHYSPLMGMVFNYNNFVDNLYRYGDPDEPAVQLVQTLFHGLPGGEIQTTHLGSSVAAHFTPRIIGEIIEAFEQLNASNGERVDEEEFALLLSDMLLDLVEGHRDYQEGQQELFEEVRKAEENLGSVKKRDGDSKPTRQTIKVLEGDVIKKGRHKIKRIEKELKKYSADPLYCRQLQVELREQEDIIRKAEGKVQELRKQIVTSLDWKTARKALRRAQDMVEYERNNRRHVLDTIVKSLCSYDLDSSPRLGTLPKFTTSMILLTYMWRKYDNIRNLEGYLESMDRIGALSQPLSNVRQLLESIDSGLSKAAPPAQVAAGHKHKRHGKHWSRNEISHAACVVTSKPGPALRPPVVPFSYVTWAAYSEFPDCGETALRNLVNQLLFNPLTGLFDHALLRELKDLHYTNLNPKLVAFYENNPSPTEATDYSVATEWINVVSNLNNGSHDGPGIRYRREKQQQNIASPLSNLLRVFNVLFGAAAVNQTKLVEVVQHKNDARGWGLSVDVSGVKSDGFGTITVSDGKVDYELQSYKPVHFGFVKTKTHEMGAAGRRNFQEFRQLMHFSHRPREGTSNQSDSEYMEQFALASLFVPYHFQKRRYPRFFRDCPSHYFPLFVDLKGKSERKAFEERVVRLRVRDRRWNDFLDRVQSYEEPSFLPTSKKDR